MRTIKVYLKSKLGEYDAIGEYCNGKMTVKKGSVIRKAFADHVRGGNIAKSLRSDPESVSEEGIVKKDCVFSSPSTAAQFVTGSSVNGWERWRVGKRTSLRKATDNVEVRK